jgi:hypothetical protein
MDIVWEYRDHPVETLYFEVEDEVAEMVTARPESFAIACLPLASWFNEKRLLVEGTLCTRLGKGLTVVNEIFHGWYRQCGLLEISASEGFIPTRPTIRRTVSLLSGGVDGLTTLCQNRLDYPLDHPDSIQACIILFGINNFDLDENGPVAARLTAFFGLVSRLRELAVTEHFQLIPVYTNVRSLAPHYRYWIKVGFGAGHSAVAQLFQKQFDQVLFASDGDGANPFPGAEHPLFNRHYSTSALRLLDDGLELLRKEKVTLLSQWGTGRRLMQPCHYVQIPEAGKINCGRCEKCVRTMLVLLGIGVLDKVDAFAENDVHPMALFRMPVNNRRKAQLLRQSIPDLQGIGRHDLVWAIRFRIMLYFIFRH